MIVIVLSKVPSSLRGTLSKWLTPIQVGVYVGVVNARVRVALWTRVQRDIGLGKAVMAYKTNTELGYAIETTNSQYIPVDHDGVSLMTHVLALSSNGVAKHGFSKASHSVKALHPRTVNSVEFDVHKYVVVDVETTGLHSDTDRLLSIGAAKYDADEIVSYVDIIKSDNVVPDNITTLTGITVDMTVNGVELVDALNRLIDFCGDRKLVAYNSKFDAAFLKVACESFSIHGLSDVWIDLLPRVKRVNMFLPNYKLSTVADAYHIINANPHSADSDAITELKLLNEIGIKSH